MDGGTPLGPNWCATKALGAMNVASASVDEIVP